MGTKIEINENSIFVNGVEYIKKQEQPTPKLGEIWYIKNIDNYEWLFIKNTNPQPTSFYVAYDYAVSATRINNRICDNESSIKILHQATPEQKEFFHSKLAEYGKKWNAEKGELEDIPKPLKRGDLVIAWDFDEKDNAIIGVYNGGGSGWCTVGDISMDNAIPFESIEQYREFIKS